MMANNLLARVSGSVISTPPARTGFFKSGHPRAGEEWVIETVNVLVGDQDVTAVQLPRRDVRGQFEGLGEVRLAKGAPVDFLVEISVFRGDPQARVVAQYPADAALDEASAA
ncbi:hypothetical protein [Arthrobacter sp. B1I2]|uniref:hypothetical protein n=1 Tax=Arthrobacter sp. B1I2 TaxID=3042263 RepID=UPI002787F25D|nr:hypothetical protein [Arthrobacter sp. B1I2]MDQ0733472.1 hypothetical protein [Arthrobacter sp. B1I2]